MVNIPDAPWIREAEAAGDYPRVCVQHDDFDEYDRDEVAMPDVICQKPEVSHIKTRDVLLRTGGNMGWCYPCETEDGKATVVVTAEKVTGLWVNGQELSPVETYLHNFAMKLAGMDVYVEDDDWFIISNYVVERSCVNCPRFQSCEIMEKEAGNRELLALFQEDFYGVPYEQIPQGRLNELNFGEEGWPAINSEGRFYGIAKPYYWPEWCGTIAFAQDEHDRIWLLTLDPNEAPPKGLRVCHVI